MPHRWDITPETKKSLDEFPSEWNGITFKKTGLPNSGIIGARNNLLWGGEGNDPFDDSRDLLLFWDSDNTGTIHDFEMMLSLKKPVVYGLYPHNKTPEMQKYFVGGCFVKNYPGCWHESDLIPVTEKRIFEGPNLWAGLGFTLIRAEILKKLRYPWVDAITVKTPPEYPRGREIVTDDVGFALNLHRAGISPVLDGRLGVGHVKRQPQEGPQTGGLGPMDAEALAVIGVVSQMSERIKAQAEILQKLRK